MAKPQRVGLNARVAPGDYQALVDRSVREGRSLGETIALVLAEHKLLSKSENAPVAEGTEEVRS